MKQDPHPDTKPEILPGACDCHVHVIGPPAEYPMVDDRHYTPPPASVENLQAHMERVGVERAVVIQPSVYGTDNRCLLAALREMNGQGRGVAVPPETISDAELRQFDQQGVTGIRLNLESGFSRNTDAVAAQIGHWSKRLQNLHWHIQIYAAFEVVHASLDLLDELPIPVVIDHFAMVPASLPPEAPAMQRLLASVRRGNVYVKLSAGYRIATEPGATMAPLAQALVKANKERILWASDWPHTNRVEGRQPTEVSEYRNIAAATLTDERKLWLPDTETAKQILVHNPARLYRY